nr:MAG TPA: hypothetical protein [Caudoviricetes sp.]
MQISKLIGIIILSFSLGFGLCYILAAREIKRLHSMYKQDLDKIKDLVDYLEKRLFKTDPNDIRKSWEYMKYMNEACEILNGGKVDEQPIL